MDLVRNTERADRNIAWIQRLRISKGEAVGEPFILAPFQAQFIRDIYEPAEAQRPDKLYVTKGVFSIGRKNGKSELAAAICLLHLIGPEAEINGEVISGATTHKQARIIFEKLVDFINITPGLKKYFKIVDSTSAITVRAGMTKHAAGSKYRAIAAGPGAAQGLNPTLIIMDELGVATSRKFYDAMVSSQKARPQPFLMVISTQADSDTHVLSTTIDAGLRKSEAEHDCGCPETRTCAFCAKSPRTIVHLYCAHADADILDPVGHRAANPALGLWIDEQRFLDEAVEVASNHMEHAQFRLYTLNQRTSDGGGLLTYEQYKQCGPDKINSPAIITQATFGFDKNEKVYGALDLSAKVDLTAYTEISAERDTLHSKAYFWKPKMFLKPHGDRDGPDYSVYSKQGWMIPTEGGSIDPAYVVQHLKDRREQVNIVGLAYDRDTFRVDELLRVMEREGVTAQNGDGSGLRIIPWGQGYQSMSIGIDAFEAAVVNNRFRHDGNPILAWCIANSRVQFDPTGRMRKLVKITDTRRIDGAVTLCMAAGLRAKDGSKVYVSEYDREGFVFEAL